MELISEVMGVLISFDYIISIVLAGGMDKITDGVDKVDQRFCGLVIPLKKLRVISRACKHSQGTFFSSAVAAVRETVHNTTGVGGRKEDRWRAEGFLC